MKQKRPSSQVTLAGGRPEDPWTGRLAAALRDRGFNAEGPSPVFHSNIGGKQQVRKPDIAVYDGVIHIGSAKVGSRQEVESLTTAQEYSQEIPLTEELTGKRLGEVFAVTYPSRGENDFILHILARSGVHNEIPFLTDSFDELVEYIARALRGEFAEVLLRAEPTQEEAKRLLHNGAFNLADTLVGVNQSELEAAFGGHSFFRAVLATHIDPKNLPNILRLGTAFLFVNQILFYSLLSRESERTSKPTYPTIKPEHADSPEELQKYFEKVRDQNYEPIYGINISHLLTGQKSRLACKSVVTAILSLAPKLDTSDLTGQVFQTLIPFEIRKPLGAHFTNPNAAMLLATVAISDPDVRLLDPACGSGTLLVSSYKRKMALARGNPEKLHQKFVEEQITGIDAMAFSGHLAAVNLALQQPFFETNHVRIGTKDSTSLRPGSPVLTTEEALPSEMRQTTLATTIQEPTNRKKMRLRVVKMGQKEPHGFNMENVDLVIMNPPFTSWDNMDEHYRNILRTRFSVQPTYRDMIYFKPSQQLFFLFLSDIFLNNDGLVAAVLPLTTFTAKSFHQFVRFLISNYTVEVIFVGLGRSAYSEDTSLTECLLVARKKVADPEHEFMLVGTRKAPHVWGYTEIINLAKQIGEGFDGKDDFSVRKKVPQSELLPENKTLSGLYLSLLDEYGAALSQLDNIVKRSSIPLIEFDQLTKEREIEATECVFSGRQFFSYGPKALIISQSKERAIKTTDRLYVDKKAGSDVVLRDRVSNKNYTFPAQIMEPAIRRFSYFKRIDITGNSDLCIKKITPDVERLIESMYDRQESSRIIGRVRAEWTKMIGRGSSRLCMMWRINWAAAGTTLISVHSDQPTFLVIKGKYFTGLSDPAHEKLLCMWFNSSPFILAYLGRARITEGTYMDLEEYALDRCPVPDVGQLTRENREAINELWERIKNIEAPSLIEQLETDHPFRTELDDGILRLLGIENAEQRTSLAAVFRRGAYAAIEALKQTMGAE